MGSSSRRLESECACARDAVSALPARCACACAATDRAGSHADDAKLTRPHVYEHINIFMSQKCASGLVLCAGLATHVVGRLKITLSIETQSLSISSSCHQNSIKDLRIASSFRPLIMSQPAHIAASGAWNSLALWEEQRIWRDEGRRANLSRQLWGHLVWVCPCVNIKI